jgi:hypothetical protein
VANPAKAKGTRHETDTVRYLNDHGIPARRVAQTGQLDTGDIHGVSPFILQCKSYRDMVAAFRDGVAGANVQAPRAGEPFGAAVVKRPGKGVADAYVAMDLATFARLLASIRARPQSYNYD